MEVYETENLIRPERREDHFLGGRPLVPGRVWSGR